MVNLLTSAQMRALEQAAIESGAASGRDLMERAGRGFVAAVFETWPDLERAPHRAVVVCGPGNNGGDGFVIARLLHDWGWQVAVHSLGTADRLPPDARINYDRWCEIGVVSPLEAAGGIEADLHVDALFGIGLIRPLEGVALDWALCPRSGRVAAVDLPSGLCSDSGRVLGAGAVHADLTVTFHGAKAGHHLAEGPAHCGRLVRAEIGLRVCSVEGAVRLIETPAPEMLNKTGSAHKYSNGHALVLTGGAGRTGAARLAARAALRIGAGVVTLGAPPAALMEVACQITAVMVRRIGTGDDLTEMIEDPRITAVCLGPGLGGRRACELVPAVVGAGRKLAVLLDADALSAFEDGPEALFAMLHPACVLTPHAGEFARLFPDIAENLAAPPLNGPVYSKVDATRAAAKRAGCVVLYKGSDTVIADPQGRCAVSSTHYDNAAPWLATAGSGDVLAGFITGLMARGFDPMQAAEMGTWLHAACARSYGPGLIAEDLPEELPKVLRALVD